MLQNTELKDVVTTLTTLMKSKHSNPPDLSNNLPLSRFHKYSSDIENFHHKNVFSCQTAENDKKTLSSLSKSTIFVIKQVVYPCLSARRTV